MPGVKTETLTSESQGKEIKRDNESHEKRREDVQQVSPYEGEWRRRGMIGKRGARGRRPAARSGRSRTRSV